MLILMLILKHCVAFVVYDMVKNNLTRSSFYGIVLRTTPLMVIACNNMAFRILIGADSLQILKLCGYVELSWEFWWLNCE